MDKCNICENDSCHATRSRKTDLNGCRLFVAPRPSHESFYTRTSGKDLNVVVTILKVYRIIADV